MSVTRWFRALAVMAGISALIAALHYAARFDLRGPDGLDSIGEWTNDPIRVIATVARWMALIMSYYLLVIVAATATATTSSRQRWIDRMIPERSAALVGLLLGLSAVVVPLNEHMSSPHHETPMSAALTLTRASDPLQLTSIPTPESALDPVPTLAATDEASAAVANGVDATDLWLVESGDHFWSIAEETLADHLGRDDLKDDEVALYWRQLIAANEDRLVEPGNPDLLLPGQQIVVPDPATNFPPR